MDITKDIAIIAIVLGHIEFLYPASQLVNTKDLFIYLWHVPVFFIVAGFFIKEEQLVQPELWFKKKFYSLYLKIQYSYVPVVLLHNVFIKIGWYSLDSIQPVIHDYSWMDFIKQIILAVCLGGREPIVGVMWFVYVLFMAFEVVCMLGGVALNGNEYKDILQLFSSFCSMPSLV